MTITRTCAWPVCGRTFEAERADARYCSPTCRARASKERKRAKGEEGGDATAHTDSRADCPTEAGPGEGSTVETGFRPDLVERIFDLEDRVDDLEYNGKEDQKKLAGIFTLPARLAEMENHIPTEARVREWSGEEALEAVHGLSERLETLEGVVSGPDGLANLHPAHARLARRVAALEDPDDVGDKSVRIKVRHLERALAREILRGDELQRNIGEIAEALGALSDLVG